MADRDDGGAVAPRTTIFALSSGRPPAGVAVIRVSGPLARTVVETMTGPVPVPRTAAYRAIRDPETGETIDRGLVIVFEGPASFTGEDSAELQVHGGRAVVEAVLAAVGAVPGLVPAEAGDFTRRAFENGRLDLTAVEGLADLIAAETEAQRRQALRIADGALARRADGWRAAIVEARASIEADLDFSDEDDVPGSVADGAIRLAASVLADIRQVLADGRRGERIRDGFQVVILGRPNAGKSSLLNALIGRDAAIVTSVPGTTRDAIEVHLDLGGAAVSLTDTAGLRDTDDPVEQEGIRRALERARAADRVIWLDEAGDNPPENVSQANRSWVAIRSKVDEPADALDESGYPCAVSTLRPETIDALIAAIGREARTDVGSALLSRARQRHLLEAAADDLAFAAADAPHPIEVRAEALRRAGDAIGRLTGRIDVEEVLGAIFSTFCIGK